MKTISLGLSVVCEFGPLLGALALKLIFQHYKQCNKHAEQFFELVIHILTQKLPFD